MYIYIYMLSLSLSLSLSPSLLCIVHASTICATRRARLCVWALFCQVAFDTYVSVCVCVCVCVCLCV